MRRPVSKYKAKRTEVDGIVFHSQKEARRYRELRLLEKAGEIESLELQPEFPLRVVLTTGTVRGALQAMNGDAPTIGKYLADFRYYDVRAGAWIVEDTKGYDTPLSKWKRKHVAAQYGIDVRLT